MQTNKKPDLDLMQWRLGALRLRVGWTVFVPLPFLGMLLYAFGLPYDPRAVVAGYLAYFGLILAHEFGHALVAWAFGLKVVAIDLHLLHGRCWVVPGKTEFGNVAIYWGGALAQLIVLGAAVAASLLFRLPNWLAPAFCICTLLNIVLLLSNLWPRQPCDGAVAWRIFPLATRLLRQRLKLPARIAGSPGLHDEADLVSYLLNTRELSDHLTAMAVEKSALLNSLAALKLEERGSLFGLMSLIDYVASIKYPKETSAPKTPVSLFFAQVRNGTPYIRQALESVGLDVRDLLFRLAHGRSEAEFVAPMNRSAEEATAVRLVNDHFTPMELVVQLLVRYTGVSQQEAVPVMLKIHQEGIATIRVCPLEEARVVAATINAEARREYSPLLCKLEHSIDDG